MNTLQSLFAFKSWSDSELFDLLADVNAQQQVDAQQHANSIHSAIRTLNHIYVVDRIFRAHLEGEPHHYTATNTEATPDLRELQFAVAETDTWFEAYSAAISAEQLCQKLPFRFTDGDAACMSREEMLVHVITHGGYHRGNVGQMLKSLSVAPPRDMYTRFLHMSDVARRQA